MMKKILLLLLLSILPAQATVKTPLQIQAEINNQITLNGYGAITGPILANILFDITNSYFPANAPAVWQTQQNYLVNPAFYNCVGIIHGQGTTPITCSLGLPIAELTGLGTGVVTALGIPANTQGGIVTMAYPTILGTLANLTPYVAGPTVTTASTSIGSPNITIPSGAASSVHNGDNVALAGCALCTTVVSGGGTTALVLDANATATNGAASATFGVQRYDVNASAIVNALGVQNLFVGAAALGHGNWTGIYDGPGRFSQIGNAQIISSNGTRALYLAGRMSDNNTGVTGFLSPETYVNETIIDAPLGGAISAWNEYTETTITSAAGAPVTGSQLVQRESDISTQWTTVSTIDPFTVNATGATIAHRLSCGKGFGPASNNCSLAVQLVNNGAAFESGFVVGATALDTAASRIAPAYSMGPNHSVSWFGAAASQAWKIYSTATTGSHSVILTDGDLQIGTSTVSLNGVAGDLTRAVNFKSSGLTRWNFGVTSTAESGANAGSDFDIARFSDAGAFIDIPFFIQRSTGFVGINQSTAFYALDVNGTTRTQRVIYNGTAPTGTTGTCSVGTFTGGTLAGTFVTPVCALAATIILSALPTAPTGYACFAVDRTTQTALILQSAASTTSATFKVSGLATVNADVVQFSCAAY